MFCDELEVQYLRQTLPEDWIPHQQGNTLDHLIGISSSNFCD